MVSGYSSTQNSRNQNGSLSASLQVVLKIIKHYQEEGQGSEVVQGVLLGLVVDDRLEITNCFPFPQHTEDDADFDEGKQEQHCCPRSDY